MRRYWVGRCRTCGWETVLCVDGDMPRQTELLNEPCECPVESLSDIPWSDDGTLVVWDERGLKR